MATDAGLAKLLSSNVECRNCALEYAYLSPNLSNDYQSLESSKLSKVAFKDYGIELVQTNGGAVCTAAWEAGQYGTSCVVSQIKGKPTAVHVIFTPAKPKVAANCEAATGLSLYKLMTGGNPMRIRLTVEGTGVRPDPKSIPRLVSWLQHRTTGQVTNVGDTPEGQFVSQMRKVSEIEMHAQELMVATGHNCKITVSEYQSLVVVEVWPGSIPELSDDNIGAHVFGQTYQIDNSELLFPAKQARANPLPGSGELTGWVFNVVKSLPDFRSEAPILGVMLNRFKDQNLKKAALHTKRESGVKLTPIVVDILGDRSNKALSQFAADMDQVSREAAGFLSTETKLSLLPMRAIWLQGMPYVEEDNVLVDNAAPAPPNWDRGLNAKQQEAAAKAFSHKFSLVWGPAATGKSQVMSRIVLRALADLSQRVLITAPTNVAVDNIFSRCARSYEAFNGIRKDANMPLTRLFSQSQIEAQYLARDPILQHKCHIEAKKLELATKQKAVNFLTGRQRLMKDGIVLDDTLAKSYYRESRRLTSEIMTASKAVFCTTAAIRDRALYWTDNTGIKTWNPTMNIMDEAACANPLELLLPMATFGDTLRSVVWAGDHYQLPAFVTSQEARAAWRVSKFEQIYRSNWTTTMLQIQYRTHKGLNDGANHVIYDDQLISDPSTENRPFLQSLLALMPLNFEYNDRSFRIRSYLHFVDVENGEEVAVGRSKYNVAEIDAIVAMIIAMKTKNSNMPLSSIAIVTGYAMQYSKIKACLAFHHQRDSTRGWDQVRIFTSGTVQGDEFEIVMLTLVRTANSRGFLGNKERANVCTTRAREAMYYFGKWAHWGSPNRSGLIWLDNIIQRERQKAKEYDREPFVVKGTPTEARLLAESRKEHEQKQARLQVEEQEAIARIKREYEAKRAANDADSRKRETEIMARFK